MKYGTTQINLPPGFAKTLQLFGESIPKEKLAGKGLDTGTPHITLYYGLEDDNYRPLQDVANRYFPFYVTLGKTGSFPANEHTEGAAVLIVEVKFSDMLRDVHRAISQSDMKLRPYDFDFTAHVTLAYMKPENVAEYVGSTIVEDQSFIATEIAVLNRDKKTTLIKPGKPA